MQSSISNIVDPPILQRQNPYKHKPIHKYSKVAGKVSGKRSASSFIPCISKDIGKPGLKNFSNMSSRNDDYWIRRTQKWYTSNIEKVKECIEQQLKQLPVLPSIQELFSLSSDNKLSIEADLNYFYRYCRVVGFLNSNHSQTILLSSDNASGVAQIGTDRHDTHFIDSLILLSQEEVQTFRRRHSFMEKIRQNESKYDSSITRMTEVSKELAFTYRIYLESRNQINQIFNSISNKIPSQQFSNSPSCEYARILLRKNLKHAFNQVSLEPLNYFKYKEHLESSRQEPFNHLRNSGDLQNFIERRRPKRGRKLLLATACSICLSDYYEQSNPFHSCSICGLRAHQMCLSFQHSKCGSCAYQKLERFKKEEVSCCFICKQQGLMIIRVADKQFAHGFCLLVHGFWRISNSVKSANRNENKSQLSEHLEGEYFLQSKFRNVNSYIEFINPKENGASVQLPAIESTMYGSNQLHLDPLDSENELSIDLIGPIKQKVCNQVWENPNDTKRSVCCYCQQSLFKNCYLSCDNCGQIYHSLCAFLAGRQLKLSQHSWPLNNENAIRLNCCCQNAGQIGWNRKYRLNYERVAFDWRRTAPYIEKGLIESRSNLMLLE